ncbi:hypothetical protein QBC38DRAFT_456514 [Podospora fimiseda]|uniref:Uncharacterized protein n=1 Tax=Podospora fimiseda TaxID=252190 RepID=A0AAN7BMS5_9PEZI|nr:hypothetical protein QBC38DRAFT_456514 [Podospora fimiseda]
MSQPTTPKQQHSSYAPLIPSPLNPVSSSSSSPSPTPKPKPSSRAASASRISPTQLLLRQKAAAAFRDHKITTTTQATTTINNNNYVPLGSTTQLHYYPSKRRQLSSIELEKQMDTEFFSSETDDLDLMIWTPEDTINMIRRLDFDDHDGDLGVVVTTTTTTTTTTRKSSGSLRKYIDTNKEEDKKEESGENTPMLLGREEEENENEKMVFGENNSSRRQERQKQKISFGKMMVVIGILVMFVLVHGLVVTFGPEAKGRRSGGSWQDDVRR